MAETPMFLPFKVIAMTTTTASQWNNVNKVPTLISGPVRSSLTEEEPDMRATVSQLVRLGLVISELTTMEVRASNRNIYKIAFEHKPVCAVVGDIHEAHPAEFGNQLVSAFIRDIKKVKI